MAINFEAANMAGYNNPKIEVFPVTVQSNSGSIVIDDAPSYSTITNIIKSGYLPTLFASLPTGDKAVLPLTAINKEGIYMFCAATYTSTSPDSKMIISIMCGENFEHPIFYGTSL